jgi:hypothetical protein
MEDRIRTFTEQEHSRFASLQQKVNREKETLLGCIRKIELGPLTGFNAVTESKNEKDVMGVMGLLMDEQGRYPSRNEVQRTTERNDNERYKSTKPARSAVPNTLVQGPNQRIGDMASNEEPLTIDTSVNESDDIFIMDAEESFSCMEIRAFENSDESAGNSSDEAAAPQSRFKGSPPANSRQYAVSLPISVPHWAPLNHAKDEDDEAGRPPHNPPEMRNLAESFRVSRLSSIVDGTELFGELPEKKVPLADLVQARPR